MARNDGQKWEVLILRGQLTCQSSKVCSRTLLAEMILHWLLLNEQNGGRKIHSRKAIDWVFCRSQLCFDGRFRPTSNNY